MQVGISQELSFDKDINITIFPGISIIPGVNDYAYSGLVGLLWRTSDTSWGHARVGWHVDQAPSASPIHTALFQCQAENNKYDSEIRGFEVEIDQLDSGAVDVGQVSM